MKKIFLIFVLLFLGTFVLAETYNGDGKYTYDERYPNTNGDLIEEDLIKLDNGYFLNFKSVNVGGGSVGTRITYTFELLSSKNKLLKEEKFSFGSWGDVDESFDFLDENNISIVKIDFLRVVDTIDGQNYPTMHITFSSYEINNSFFNKIGNWFKCLFSRKC